MPVPQDNKIYTYKDLKDFPENERWELIDGIPYLQAAPTWQHQEILGNLFFQIKGYLIGKECKVFMSPFDVCLESKEDSKNVFQPDIVIICDLNKLKKTGYFGSPTIAIEIISPSTAKHDRIKKFNKYLDAKVQEYWIIEPTEKIIEIFTLKDNQYIRSAYSEDDKTIDVKTFSGLQIDLNSVFPE